MTDPAGETAPLSAPASRAAIAWFFALSGLSFSNWAVRIPDIRAQLELSQSQLGALLLCPVIGSLCLTLLSNYFNTRFGSRRITRVAACAIVASLVLIGLAVSMLTLGLALVVFGAGMGLLNIAMNDQAATLERRYRRSIMSSFHGLFSLGGMIGSLIGGALATLGLTPRWHLLLVAVLLLVGTLISHRHLLAPPPRAERPVGALFVRPKGRVWLLGIIAAAVVFIEGSMADWSALFLTELGASRGPAPRGRAGFTRPRAGGRGGGVRWLDRVGAVRALEAGSALALAGLGLAIVAADPLVALAGFALAGIGMSTLFPCLLSLAGRNRAMSPSSAIASVAMLGYLSMLGGPPLLGFLAEAITLHYAFIALALAAALAIILARPAAQA